MHDLLTTALAQDGVFALDDVRQSEAERMLEALGRVDRHRNTTLKPSPGVAGRSWTHSDNYGFGEFPWHTDGAVTDSPPRFVALLGIEVGLGVARTEFVDLRNADSLSAVQSLKRCFLTVSDQAGTKRVLRASEVKHGSRLYRWDLRCCKPEGGRESVENVASLQPTIDIEWKIGRLVIFDNWRFLHRRLPVSQGAVRTLWRGYAYQAEVSYVV